MVEETGLGTAYMLTLKGLLSILARDAWLARLAEHVTLDLGIVSSCLTLGIEIT